MSNKTKIIGCASGLCNRIRVLSNWYGRAEHIRMLWPVNTDCPAFWTDLFEPIIRVNFVISNSSLANKYKPKITIQRYLTLLDFKPKIEIPFINEPYVAIHIRKTDLVKVQKSRNIQIKSELEYIEEAESYGIDLIYLATDNQKSQGILKRHFKERLLYYKDIVGYGSNYKPIRCTSMKHAVADLYICTNATQFISTNFSSFSGTIHLARKTKNEMGSSSNNSTS